MAVNLKGSTTRAAESHLRAHIIPKLGSLPLTEINTKTVQNFVAYLATGGRSKKTVENVLLTLSSILRTARSWDHACGNFSLADITMPRAEVKKEQRHFTDEEVGKILSAASEPFGTILAVTAVLGLRIGEVLALRVSDIDFVRKIVRVRQSVDAATRNVQAVKSQASSADVPIPSQLAARRRSYRRTHDGISDPLCVNRRGRPFSANKLREKRLHPLLVKLGIPRGGFHAARHGATSALLADGATPAVVQKQLRHSDPRITLGIYGHVIGRWNDPFQTVPELWTVVSVTLPSGFRSSNLSPFLSCSRPSKATGTSGSMQISPLTSKVPVTTKSRRENGARWNLFFRGRRVTEKRAPIPRPLPEKRITIQRYAT